jgi:hypothetical protein
MNVLLNRSDLKPLKAVKTKKSFYSVFMGAILIVAGIGLLSVTVTATENAVVGPRAVKQSAIKQTLLEYTACYAEVMGITPRWEVDVEFEYDLAVDEDDRWAAATDAEPDYLTVTITYNLAYLKDASDQELRETVIHELVLVGLWELLELIPEEAEELSHRREEQLTTEVSRLPFWQDLCRGSTATPGKATPAGLRRVN